MPNINLLYTPGLFHKYINGPDKHDDIAAIARPINRIAKEKLRKLKSYRKEHYWIEFFCFGKVQNSQNKNGNNGKVGIINKWRDIWSKQKPFRAFKITISKCLCHKGLFCAVSHIFPTDNNVKILHNNKFCQLPIKLRGTETPTFFF